MSIQSYLMAKFYDAAMQKLEKTCLQQWRMELLANITGHVLEIGSGTGGNIPFYPDSLASLVLTEPEPYMLQQLQKRIQKNLAYQKQIQVHHYPAEKLEFPDEQFDAAVCTLVLCSVASPQASLQEIKRVLKPGGKLYFIEHILATSHAHRIKWQRFFQPIWKRVCGNCHLTRDTESYIAEAGFSFERLEKLELKPAPLVVREGIQGIAWKH